jgi:hypothetical protein
MTLYILECSLIHTSEDLNKTIINLFHTSLFKKQLMFRYHAFNFFGRHKVIAAIPLLKDSLLKRDLDTFSYYNLVLIDAKYHFLYKNKMSGEYDLYYNFLKTKKIENGKSLEHYYKLILGVCDEEMLELFRNIDISNFTSQEKKSYKHYYRKMRYKTRLINDYEKENLLEE